MPPTSVVTIGVPLAMASSSEIGMLSASDGLSAIAALRYCSAMCSLSRRPVNTTASPMPSSALRRSRSGRRGPEPATTRRALGCNRRTMANARIAVPMS